MIRLLIATSDRQAGGIRRALSDQLALLSSSAFKTSFEITILSPDADFLAQANSQQHATLSLSSTRRFLFRYLPAFATSDLPKQHFDIALCHNGFMAKGLTTLAKKVIGICHNDKSSQFWHCDDLVCLTEDGRQKALQEGWQDKQLHVISHYHNYHIKKAPELTSESLTIGAAGRFVPKKNMALFIETAALVKDTHPDIEFLLAGSGPEKDSLLSLNDKLGHPVRYLGWTDFEVFLSQLDIMMVPSTDEPFGYVYPEAMSQGIAILSTPTFGGRHCLKQGQIAPLLPADDPLSFAAEIRRLNDDRAHLRDIQNACLAHVKGAEFSQQAAVQKWAALLQL